MERWPLSQDDLTPEELAVFERLDPLFEQERIRMARALATGRCWGRRSLSCMTRESLQDTLRYFRNHCLKMDYLRYEAKRWQIGYGLVQILCKTVIGNRLQGGGMRWDRPQPKADEAISVLTRRMVAGWEKGRVCGVGRQLLRSRLRIPTYVGSLKKVAPRGHGHLPSAN